MQHKLEHVIVHFAVVEHDHRQTSNLASLRRALAQKMHDRRHLSVVRPEGALHEIDHVVGQHALVVRQLGRGHELLDRRAEPRVLAQVLVRRVVLFHVQHQRNVHVLLQTQQVLDLPRLTLHERVQLVHDKSHRVVDAPTRRGIPKPRHVLSYLERDVRKVIVEQKRVRVPQKLLLQQFEVDERVVSSLPRLDLGRCVKKGVFHCV